MTKLPISKDDSFLKSNFNLNQICKAVLTQSHETWHFNATNYRLRKCFEVIENVKKLKFEGDWTNKPGQNTWNKIKKSNKVGQDKKSAMSIFCQFFHCYILLNFYFSPNDSPSKTMKNAFYFI